MLERQVIVWDRGRPARKRAAGAQLFESRLPIFFALRAHLRARAPAVPDKHLMLGLEDTCHEQDKTVNVVGHCLPCIRYH